VGFVRIWGNVWKIWKDLGGPGRMCEGLGGSGRMWTEFVLGRYSWSWQPYTVGTVTYPISSSDIFIYSRIVEFHSVITPFIISFIWE
jgi:hypothetical protein